MFINFTNHDSAKWSAEQLTAASQYGKIINMPFPDVDAEADEYYIEALAQNCVDKIAGYHPNAVLCQGEMTLAFAVVKGLMVRGITVLAACSRRNVIERISRDGRAVKYAEFQFTCFRKYHC